MNITVANLPDIGTPLTITTVDDAVYHGWLRHISGQANENPFIGVQEGAGWWNLDLVQIRSIKVTGPVRAPAPPRQVRGRLAFPE